MMHDNHDRHEEEVSDLIEEVCRGWMNRTHASPDFHARVMAKAAMLPRPSTGLRGWLQYATRWHAPTGAIVRFAVAAMFVLALIGAIPQYITWIGTYWADHPPQIVLQGEVQEKLWEKNLACLKNLDPANHEAIQIAERLVEVVICPSGDVQVKIGPPDSTKYEAMYLWVDLQKLERLEKNEWGRFFQLSAPEAFAAEAAPRTAEEIAQTTRVLCQERLPNGFIRQRIQLANGKCQDEIINPRTGKVVDRKPAPCEPC